MNVEKLFGCLKNGLYREINTFLPLFSCKLTMDNVQMWKLYIFVWITVKYMIKFTDNNVCDYAFQFLVMMVEIVWQRVEVSSGFLFSVVDFLFCLYIYLLRGYFLPFALDSLRSHLLIGCSTQWKIRLPWTKIKLGRFNHCSSELIPVCWIP